MYESRNTSTGEKAGRFIGVVLVGCAAALAIAGTTKIITWMF
jgi:hypothetical protein